MGGSSSHVSSDVLGIEEGSAKIYFPSHIKKSDVFYNPVQEFNRDLTCAVIQAYRDKLNKDISIFEAFSATGLRSIRYAKEIRGVKKIIANDIDIDAVSIIEKNIKYNDVSSIVKSSHGDAKQIMSNSEEKYDVIDIDPYSTAAPFLHSALQCASDGALLCITSTDGRTLNGVQPDVAFSWYGSVPMNAGFSHEFGIRVLLTTLFSTAARFGKIIIPLLCLHVDFYVRIFVQVKQKPIETKKISGDIKLILYSRDTYSFWSQPMGDISIKGTNVIARPSSVRVGFKDPFTNCSLTIGGPIYCGPLHSKDFLNKVLDLLPLMKYIHTEARIKSTLNICMSESDDLLYYQLEKFTSILRCQSISNVCAISALERLGYRATRTHCCPGAIKTNAPPEVLWDIVKKWYYTLDKSDNFPKGSVASNILSVDIETNVDLTVDKNVEERLMHEKRTCRFYENPKSNFGPKPAAKKNYS